MRVTHLLVGCGVLSLGSGARIDAEEVEGRLVLLWLQGISPGRAAPPSDGAQAGWAKRGRGAGARGCCSRAKVGVGTP